MYSMLQWLASLALKQEISGLNSSSFFKLIFLPNLRQMVMKIQGVQFILNHNKLIRKIFTNL